MKNTSETLEKQHPSTREWLWISELEVNLRAQREYKPAQAERYAANFDFDALGLVIVNKRDDHYYLVDGQHRIGALRLIGYGGDQKVECQLYKDLTEGEEAEIFLLHDDRRAVTAFDRFRIGTTAGRAVPRAITKVLDDNGLMLSTSPGGNRIACVAALTNAYERLGNSFGRMIGMLNQGFPDDEVRFRSELVRGVTSFAQHYDSELDNVTIRRLAGIRAGASGLLRRAEALRLKTGMRVADCVAVAIVDVHNSGRGQRLKGWFD